MITKKVTECIEKAMEHAQVRQVLEYRDQHANYRFRSVCGKLMRIDNTPSMYGIVVRIGFDFDQLNNSIPMNEDLIVDVTLVKNKQTGSETFDVVNIAAVPNLPNP